LEKQGGGTHDEHCDDEHEDATTHVLATLVLAL
jgi:hypothetical protein